MERDPGNIIFYDGECGLCDRAVQFILPRDKQGFFRFAAIQSSAGTRLLSEHGMDPTVLDTFVLLEQGKIYVRSEAALRVARRLNGGWPLAYGLVLVPKGLRDQVYRFIAQRRRRWFGGPESCRLPDAASRGRFLNE